MPMTREAATAVAIEFARKYPKGYVTEPFAPHEWVIQALMHVESSPGCGGPAGVGYFAADPGCDEFVTFPNLELARQAAAKMLASAEDEAVDTGWADEPPQICFGVLLGHCVEADRRPAPAESEFSEIVEFRLVEADRVSRANESPRSAEGDGYFAEALALLEAIAERETTEPEEGSVIDRIDKFLAVHRPQLGVDDGSVPAEEQTPAAETA